jgi:hypothetical protein
MRIMEESACKADASETLRAKSMVSRKSVQACGFDLGNRRVKVHAIQAQNCATIVL